MAHDMTTMINMVAARNSVIFVLIDVIFDLRITLPRIYNLHPI